MKAKMIGTFVHQNSSNLGAPFINYSFGFRDESRVNKLGKLSSNVPALLMALPENTAQVAEYVKLLARHTELVVLHRHKTRKVEAENTPEPERKAEEAKLVGIEAEAEKTVLAMMDILDQEAMLGVERTGHWFELSNVLWTQDTKSVATEFGDKLVPVVDKKGTPCGSFERDDVTAAPRLTDLGKAETGVVFTLA
jgi:hypothetical protein